MAKSKKKSDRAKGLAYLREVKEILKRNGCDVEGPGYGLRFFSSKKSQGNLSKQGEPQKAKPVLVHADYFGCFDLISFRPDMGFVFHQVSIIEEKSRKVNDLMEANKPGWIWGRYLEANKVAYRIFAVRDTEVIEREGVIFLTEAKKPQDLGLSGSGRKLEITLFEKGEMAWNSLSS